MDALKKADADDHSKLLEFVRFDWQDQK